MVIWLPATRGYGQRESYAAGGDRSL